MLSEELLTINKIVQGDIAVIDAIDWFVKLDKATQRSVVSTARMGLERANPNQDGVDKVFERWHRAISLHVADILEKGIMTRQL